MTVISKFRKALLVPFGASNSVVLLKQFSYLSTFEQ